MAGDIPLAMLAKRVWHTWQITGSPAALGMWFDACERLLERSWVEQPRIKLDDFLTLIKQRGV